MLETTLYNAVDICYNKGIAMNISPKVYQTIGNKVIEYINGGIQMNFDLHKMPTTMSDLLQTNKKQHTEFTKELNKLHNDNSELRDMIENLIERLDMNEEHSM